MRLIIVKKVLERGFRTILMLPYGILNLKIRKDLKENWNLDNILITSISKPNENLEKL